MIKHVSMLRNSYQAFGSSLANTIGHRFQRAGSLRCDLGVALEDHQIALVRFFRQGRSILSSLADRVATENDEMQQFAQLAEILGHYHRQRTVNSVSIAISGARVLREPFEVPKGVSNLHIERFSKRRAEQLGQQLGVDVCHDFYLFGHGSRPEAANGRRGELVVCRRSTVDTLVSAVARSTSAALRVVPECIAFSLLAQELEGGWLCWRRGRCYELLTDGAEQSVVVNACEESPEQERHALEALLRKAGECLGDCAISLAGEPFLNSTDHLTHAIGKRFVSLDMAQTVGVAGSDLSFDGANVVALALANGASTSRALVPMVKR